MPVIAARGRNRPYDPDPASGGPGRPRGL